MDGNSDESAGSDMWQTHVEPLENLRGSRVIVLESYASSPLKYGEIIELWRTDAVFRSWFDATLAESPYTAFRWETPAVTAATVDQPFEFVLLDSPGLERPASTDAFASQFDAAGADDFVVEFANLGGDATLIVPTPFDHSASYGHLAAFLRTAPNLQRDALWKCVGEAMARRLSSKPVWLNTAGAGMPWLHVRLDERPKYYGHAPYRTFPSDR